jgi:hypothetical protein
MRIRYKYRNQKEGFQLSNIKCPICGSTHKNRIKVVEHTSYAGKVKLLVECWSGDINKEMPKHLYLIELEDLPIIEAKKV